MNRIIKRLFSLLTIILFLSIFSKANADEKIYIGEQSTCKSIPDAIEAIPENAGAVTLLLQNDLYEKEASWSIPENKGITSLTIDSATNHMATIQAGFIFANGIPFVLSKNITLENATLFAGGESRNSNHVIIDSGSLTINGYMDNCQIFGGGISINPGSISEVKQTEININGVIGGAIFAGGAAQKGSSSTVSEEARIHVFPEGIVLNDIYGTGVAQDFPSVDMVNHLTLIVDGDLDGKFIPQGPEFEGGIVRTTRDADVQGHVTIFAEESETAQPSENEKILSSLKMAPKDHSIYFFTNDLVPAVKNGKVGYINKEGVFVIEPNFDFGDEFSANGLAKVRTNGKTGWIDQKGNFVIQPEFEGGGIFSDNGLASAKKDNLWGWIDRTGSFVIQPAFDESGWFVTNEIGIYKSNDKEGLINKEGKIITEALYSGISLFGDNLFLFTLNEERGIMDSQGKILIDPFYSLISLEDGHQLALACSDSGCGLINRHGKVIAKPIYDYFEASDTELMKVTDSKNDVTGWIDSSGAAVIPVKYSGQQTGEFSANGLANVSTSEGIGYINRKNEFVIPPKFSVAYPFGKNGLASACEKEQGCGIINEEGNFICHYPEDVFGMEFSDNGLLSFTEKRKYGFLNESCEIIIKPQYSYAYKFDSYNHAIVQSGDKYGMINEKGEIVLPIIYSQISKDIFTDYLVLKSDNLRGFASPDGTLIFPAISDDFLFFINNQAVIFGINGKKGLLDLKGRIIAPPVFNSIYPIQTADNLLEISLEGDTGYMDLEGNLTYLEDLNGELVPAPDLSKISN